MTREQAARLTQPHIQEVLLAYAQGETIQYSRSGEGWTDCVGGPDPHGDFISSYRIKPPEPKLRAWKPEEVPVGALIRFKGNDISKTLILGFDSNRGFIVDGTSDRYPGEKEYTTVYAMVRHEYSIDGGKTWHPCGILE